MAFFFPDVVILSLFAVVGSSGALFFTWLVGVSSVSVGSDEMRLSLSSTSTCRLSTARCALVLLVVPSRFSCTSWVLFEGFLVVALCDADADSDGSLVLGVVLNALVLLDRSTVRVFVPLDFLEGRHLLRGASVFFLAVTNSRVLRRVLLRLGELLRLAVVSSAIGEGLLVLAFVSVFVFVLVVVVKDGVVMIEGVVRDECGEDSSSWWVLVRFVATTSVGIG